MKEEKKEQRQRKRWMSLPYRLLGALLVIAGMFCFTGMETEAAFESHSKLSLDGFTFVNSGKFLAASCTDGKGGTAVYNPDKNTLTLTNYTFKADPRETEPESIIYYSLMIYGMGDITLVLKGTNTIQRNPLQENIGIKIMDDCVIEGDGTLISNALISQYDKNKLTIRDCNIQIDSPYAGIGAGELVVENADISLKSAHSIINAWGIALWVEKLTVKESNITAITPPSNCMSLWVSREINGNASDLVKDPAEKIILSADETVTDEAGNPLRIEELSYGGRSWYVYTAKSEAEYANNPKNGVARCVKITSRTRSERQARIKAVEELIAGIGKVTIDSGTKIEAARRAYEQLSEAEKKKVANAEILFQAETAYAQVKKQVEEAKQQAEAEAKKKAAAEAAKKKAEEKTGVLSGTGGKTARTVKIKGRKYTIRTPRLKSVTSKSRRTVRVVWTTDRKNSGYQLVYSTSRKFKRKKTVWIRKAKTGKLTLKKLKSRRTYYVKLRAYRTIKGKRYYSDWSAVGRRIVK